jgi:hypothetical protein
MSRKAFKTPEELQEKNRLRQKRYYWRHRDRFQKYTETFNGRYRTWKAHANHRKIKWELSKEDLEPLPRICYYTGIELNLKMNDRHLISLDRLDSNKGYTKDNVVFCCGFINRMKSDLSVEQFISTCEAILNHFGKKR